METMKTDTMKRVLNSIYGTESTARSITMTFANGNKIDILKDGTRIYSKKYSRN